MNVKRLAKIRGNSDFGLIASSTTAAKIDRKPTHCVLSTDDVRMFRSTVYARAFDTAKPRDISARQTKRGQCDTGETQPILVRKTASWRHGDRD